MEKTLAMKLLEGRKVPYQLFSYPETERNAVVIAGIFNVPPAQLFKTLVIPRSPAKPILAMIPADRQLDLKKLAQTMNEKKLKLATHKEAEQLTGLQVGGISPLALLNRGFAILMDESAQQYEEIFVSAGKKGLNLKLPVKELQKITGARYAPITTTEEAINYELQITRYEL